MNEPELVEAIEAQGPDYVPRTHHLDPSGAPRFTNRLILETSPYLLQHAHNPVDWRPWSDAAFAEAAERGVPVFLSVGYSTCHWCHVMERESFEDLEIAAYLNAHFVPVKLDREERPDVDALYMEFVQSTTGRGGWPMSVFLTPAREPLFGGTYYPARDGDRGVSVGFLTLLQAITRHWEDPEFAAAGARVAEQMRRPRPEPAEALPGLEPAVAAAERLMSGFDPRWGGFGRAPKFPRPAVYDFMLREWARTGEGQLGAAVSLSLERMYCGGIYDHVGGGFARYSTDERWLVPHFEKMLYDNAQLVVTYVEAWQATGRPLFAWVARDVLEYLMREMSHPEGGFYSATDADSEGEEGRFFLWTPEQVAAALGAEDAAWVCRRFDITEAGNFEGRSIPNLQAPLEPGELQRWERLRERLYEAREQRVRPGLDDKILTSWNALAISAFARAGFALDEPRFVERARKAATFLCRELVDQGRLLRAWRRGRAQHEGVLEDYAALVNASLDLLEATGDAAWLEGAQALVSTLEERFAAPEGGYFRSADDVSDLPVRDKPEYDGAEPSGNSLAALGLVRLAEITGRGDYLRAAEATLKASAASLDRAPTALPKLLTALQWLRAEAQQIVVVTPSAEAAQELLAPIRSRFLPHRVLLTGPEGGRLATLASDLFEGRSASGDAAVAYVCRGRACDLPTMDPQQLEAQLRG